MIYPFGFFNNPSIAIDPEVSAWVNRVIANSGSVSAATVDFVNTFVLSLKAAGLRSKLLRLNLFIGNNLEACLTPLFANRDESVSVFLGNTYDINNNFIGSDYNETGASGGLAGDASSKYLDTGFNPSLISEIGVNTGGLISYNRTAIPITGGVLVGATATSPSVRRLMMQYNAIGPGHNYFGMSNSPGVNFGEGKGLAVGVTIVGGTQTVYFNSIPDLNKVVAVVGKPNANVLVFASSLNLNKYLYTDALQNCYGITDNITTDSEAILISTLINDFYVNFSRNEY